MEKAQFFWRFEMLGGLRAQSGERVLERFPTQKTAALLAFLTYPPARRHSREQLVDLLWPDADPDSGRNRLSQALVWLRPQLEPPDIIRGSILLTDRVSVGLNPDSITSDVAEFELALRRADKSPDPEAQIQALTQAAQLYQGELLPAHYEDWVLAERRRLSEAYLRALRQLAALFEQDGDFDRAADYLRRVLDADPLQEEAHGDLMRILASSGQPAAALRQYQELERLLARELDTTPSAASRALLEQIRQTDTLVSAPAPKRGEIRRPALPVPMTRFFGREAELTRLTQMIQSEGTRLVTLMGTGGSGKTRLALETATTLSEAFSGAVAFVALADVNDSDMIPSAIASALRLPRSSADPLDTILGALADHRTLLVLDNLEHLTTGAAAWVHELLVGAPLLTILVTSRQRLGVEGERELPVSPLPLPMASASPQDLLASPSAQLFLDRARAVRPDFEITFDNVAAVASVCERLEGVPLAIELCAAWAQTLAPAQMLEKLGRRFDLLVSRRADIAPRHRTLRAALEYGFVQLSPDLQRMFASLSVFRGGWSLVAAEAVCLEDDASSDMPSVLDALTELRERSLLVAEDANTEMRYRMLEALREFAAEQRTLAIDAPLRRRHAHYFFGLANEAASHLVARDQVLWLNKLEIEHENMRVALTWALETDTEIGLKLATALSTFWVVRGFASEGQGVLERLLALPTNLESAEARALRAQALNALGDLARARTDFAASEIAVQEALSLWRGLEDASGMAACLQILATLFHFREDYDGARMFLLEALDLGRLLDDSSIVAGVLLNLGNIAMEQEEWPQAWDLFTESLALSRTESNPNKIASALNNLGLIARYQGDLATAQALFLEDLAICRNLSNPSGAAIALLNLGTVYRLAGSFDEARSALTEATALASESDNKRALAWCLKGFAHLFCAEHNYALGIRLLSAVESLRIALGISFKPADPEELNRDMALARVALGEMAFAAAWSGGSNLPLDDALTEALHTPI